jgi:cytochrome c
MRIAFTIVLLLAFALGAGPWLLSGQSARAEGDSSAGRKNFKQCRNCHSARQGKTGTFGPNLYQVVGRIVGTGEGHNYSPALDAADFAWTPELLGRWLTDPQTFLPGAEIEFLLDDAEERANVIAYLIAAGKR